MTNDKQLTPHFTLFALTRTDHADLQAENRHVTTVEEAKLREVAELLEKCHVIIGCDLEVHSGRRYLELNKRVGGSDRSQHMKCEAADFSPAGPDTEETVVDAWQKLAKAARAPGSTLKFGQLIVENAAGRDGARKFWIHISLGAPYRDKARCGEVLTMKDGKFTMISKIA
jgi:hypothetical protein